MAAPVESRPEARAPQQASVSPPSGQSTEVDAALLSLSRLLFTYVVALTALATLSPFRFVVPTGLEINTAVVGHDVALNLLLMMPSGFLYALSRSPVKLTAKSADAGSVPAANLIFRTWLIFTAMSLALECGQLFLPARFSSPVDVLINGLGAAMGAWVLTRLGPFLGHRLGNEMTVRMPLSHLFYLLSLLTVIDSLMAREAGVRLWLLLPLGAMGAVLASAIYTHRLRQTRDLPPLRMALLTSGWFLLVSAPGTLRAPQVGLAGGALVFMLSHLAMVFGFPRGGRRFELPTLRALLLPGLLYLLGLCHGYEALRPVSEVGSLEHTHQGVFDVIEILAALTVLGYGIAEALGRSALSRWSSLGVTLVAATSVVVALESLGSALSDLPVRPWLALAALPAAAFGAAVYRRELILVQALSRSLLTTSE